jgi:hypothetical protein
LTARRLIGAVGRNNASFVGFGFSHLFCGWFY